MHDESVHAVVGHFGSRGNLEPKLAEIFNPPTLPYCAFTRGDGDGESLCDGMGGYQPVTP